MTASLGAARFLLNTLTWAQAASNPNGNLAAPVGSQQIRSGTLPATPTEIYAKLTGGSTNQGWVKQNLWDLKVFNIKSYGAVGDGSTDDTVAIQNAINALVANGGGILYIPPAVVNGAVVGYRVTKPALKTQSFELTNVHNMVWMGDGYSSMITMIGSAGGGEWDCIRSHDGSSRLMYLDFCLDGNGITNLDPSKQHHLIENQGSASDTHGGTNDVEIYGMYFNYSPGDAIRNLGESNAIVSNIRIRNCWQNGIKTGGGSFCRSFTEAQRYSRMIQVHFNRIYGSHDNEIDFEPTGGSGLNTAGPEEWSILGNHFDHQSIATAVITYSGTGAVDASHRCILAYNTVINGGVLIGVYCRGILIKGNVVRVNSGDANAVIGINHYAEECEIYANVCLTEDSTGRVGIGFTPDPSNNLRNAVEGNVIVVLGVGASGGQGVSCDSATENVANGNLIQLTSDTANVSVGVNFKASVSALEHCFAVGNMTLSVTQNVLDGVRFAASAFNCGNSAAVFNYTRGCFGSVRWERTGANTFTGFRVANGNNASGETNADIEYPATNVGAEIEGNSPPGTGFTGITLAAGPAGQITAPVGSLNLNTLGGVATTLFYKESGTGVTGGTAGWISDGPEQIIFAVGDTTTTTSALFMAPGDGLPTATAVEIQIPICRAGTIRTIRVACTAGTGAGTTTYTLRRNGVNTGVTVVINTTATGGTATSSTNCAAGDLLSLQITKSAPPTGGQTNVAVTLDLTS